LPVIGTDCPTGVREVLSPGGDPGWRPITEPEYSEYGVLMPLIRDGDVYESDIALWSDTVVKLLANEDLMKDYQVKASRRAAELSQVNFIRHWKNLLNVF
jgi:glycosyltransferase involved in cell wall biosynthesis